MNIVKVNHTNIHDLYRLNKQLACDEGQKDLFTVCEADYTKAFLVDNPILYGYIVYTNHTPIGFYIYNYKFATYIGSKVLYIEDIYITSDYATLENKQLLLEHAITSSAEEKCCRVEIRMLKAFNIGYDVVDAYGFNLVDKWQVYRLDK